MTALDLTDLDRGRRASIILRADLRGQLHSPAGGPQASPAVAKLVLFVLDSFPPDRCFPSEPLIARCACTTERTLRRSIQALIAGGLLETAARATKGTRYRSSRSYVIRYDRLAPLDPRLQEPGPASPAPANMAAPNGQPAPANVASQPRPIWPPTTSKATEELKSSSRATEAQRRVIADLQTARVIEDYVAPLIRLGFTRGGARKVLREAGSLQRIQEVLALLAQRDRKRPIKNPPGFITQAIREEWTPAPTPAGAPP